MLALHPVTSHEIWMLYRASGDGVPGVPRAAATGDAEQPQAAHEAHALATLRARLREAERQLLFRAARVGAPPPDEEVAAAYRALEPRAARTFEAAASVLDAWARALREGDRPSWFAAERDALARFMGGEADCAVRVFLLSAGPAANGLVWQTFIGVGYRALWCGGPPHVHEPLHEDLLHTAAHAAQSLALDPLIAAFLATDKGRRLEAAFERTPYAPRRRHIPRARRPRDGRLRPRDDRARCGLPGRAPGVRRPGTAGGLLAPGRRPRGAGAARPSALSGARALLRRLGARRLRAAPAAGAALPGRGPAGRRRLRPCRLRSVRRAFRVLGGGRRRRTCSGRGQTRLDAT